MGVTLPSPVSYTPMLPLVACTATTGMGPPNPPLPRRPPPLPPPGAGAVDAPESPPACLPVNLGHRYQAPAITINSSNSQIQLRLLRGVARTSGLRISGGGRTGVSGGAGTCLSINLSPNK